MAIYKNDIVLIAGSGDFAYEAANFLFNKKRLNHIVLLSKNNKISKLYNNIVSHFDINNNVDGIFVEYNKILNQKLGHIQK